MPDPNKHAALENAGFKLQPVCATCVHWKATQTDWGRCGFIGYQHWKHTEARTAGTPSMGHCRYYLTDTPKLMIAAGIDYANRYAPDHG